MFNDVFDFYINAFINKLERHIESSSTNSDYCQNVIFKERYASFLNGESTSVFVYNGDCFCVSANFHRDWMKRLEDQYV